METLTQSLALPLAPSDTAEVGLTVFDPWTVRVKRHEKSTDHLLMELVKEGDTEAFREIVHRYKDPITNYVYRILNDYDTAVDISQEVFLRVFRKAHSYEPLAAFSTWIYRIATNLSINEVRRRKRGMTISIFSRLGDY